MKTILIFLSTSLFIFSSYAQVLDPSKHTGINKPIVVSGNKPLDGKSMFYLNSTSQYRDFNSIAEANSYVPANQRSGHPFAFIRTGNVVNLYWWRNGTTNSDLELLSSSSASQTWGNITGTLSNQTDLSTALSAKANSTHTHDATVLTSGFIPSSRFGAGTISLNALVATGTANATTFMRGDGTWAVPAGGGSSSAWGAITGTLSNQTDLSTALSAKANSTHTHTTTDITSGVIPAARFGAGTVPINAIAATGTPNASTTLMGNGTWSTVSTPASVSTQIKDSLDASARTFKPGANISIDSSNVGGKPVYTISSMSNARAIADGDYTVTTSDNILILPDPSATRTLTLPAASTMPGQTKTIYCSANVTGEWLLSGSYIQSGTTGSLVENFTNSGLPAGEMIMLVSANTSPNVWRWIELK